MLKIFSPKVNIVITCDPGKYLFWRARVLNERGQELHVTKRSVGVREPQKAAEEWARQNGFTINQVIQHS
ncbi:MAG: hypothetical protein IT315_06800 [Anaerolineales bacterium]|nr:hypothetical protein [Anaerolineales bacterium]